MPEGESHYFATRHAKPERNKTLEDPASQVYPDLTERGVAQAREKAKGQIFGLVKDAAEGAVILIGATSDQPRTKQTAEIYGDELAVIQRETKDENLVVITKSDIEAMIPEEVRKSFTDPDKKDKSFMPGQIARVVKNIEQIIQANPGKKIIIDYPLTVKQLAYKYNNRWTDKAGNKTEYFSAILKKHNNNHEAAGKDWIANQGRLELSDGKVLQGPIPEQVGKDYFEGVNRLHDFARQYIGDRPLVVGEVGHQWDLDALVTSLANKGKVDREAFERVTGGDIAGETEMTEFVVTDKETKVKYRGKEFVIEN